MVKVKRPNDKRWKQIHRINTIQQLQAEVKQRFEVKDKKVVLVFNDVEIETTEDLQPNMELILEEE